jgi:hypothetical protein
VQIFPAAVSAQLRMCDGLEVVLRDAEERIRLLCGRLVYRKREINRVSRTKSPCAEPGTMSPERLLITKVDSSTRVTVPPPRSNAGGFPANVQGSATQPSVPAPGRLVGALRSAIRPAVAGAGASVPSGLGAGPVDPKPDQNGRVLT